MGCCEHGNEHSVKCGEVLDCLRNYQHFKKDCDVWQSCGAVAAWQREVASVADSQVRSLRETQLDHSQGTINKRQARPAGHLHRLPTSRTCFISRACSFSTQTKNNYFFEVQLFRDRKLNPSIKKH